MPSFALAAIGRDRPGIVAAVARVLYEHGCNVEDASMTLLRGNFSIMLILSAAEGASAEALEDALREACRGTGLTLSVLPVDDTPSDAAASHILTVYGADRPGILFRVSEALATRGVNITDLNSRLVGGADPVYAVMLELSVPPDPGAEELERTLTGLAAEIGVDVSLRPLDEDIL
jgi:glycine cleavage system transcriptional repressor